MFKNRSTTYQIENKFAFVGENVEYIQFNVGICHDWHTVHKVEEKFQHIVQIAQNDTKKKIMAKRTLIGCQLCILNLLILNVIAHVIESVPLCGTMDGSPPKDSDKIYFKDRNLGIRTVEINGKIYACYPDGTMVDTSSSKSSESNETIDETTLNSRIQSGKNRIFLLLFKFYFRFFFCLTLTIA